MGSDLAQRIRSIDVQLGAVELSPAARARIRNQIATEGERFERGRVSPRAWSAVAFAGGGAACVLLLWGASEILDPAGTSVSELRAVQTEEGVEGAAAAEGAEGAAYALREVGGRCRIEREGDVLGVTRDCYLRMDTLGVDVRVMRSGSLVESEQGLRVRDGWMMFEVEEVQKGALPVVVQVPAGAIAVLGTQFSVFADASRGHVDLIEGSIQFTDGLGQVTLIEPGERVTWRSSDAGATWITSVDRALDPTKVVSRDLEATAVESRAATRQPSVGASANAQRRRPSSGQASSGATNGARKRQETQGYPAWLAEALVDVQRLRAVRRYREALRVLERTRRKVRDAKVAEVLAYEAGTLLESLGDTKAACEHWHAHTRDYPNGRYLHEIRLRLARSECRPEGASH
ncbi:MAG: FecR domain-containing protein [Nannocystaceae bacterium]